VRECVCVFACLCDIYTNFNIQVVILGGVYACMHTNEKKPTDTYTYIYIQVHVYINNMQTYRWSSWVV